LADKYRVRIDCDYEHRFAEHEHEHEKGQGFAWESAILYLPCYPASPLIPADCGDYCCGAICHSWASAF
jgi:hypothetical protein